MRTSQHIVANVGFFEGDDAVTRVHVRISPAPTVLDRRPMVPPPAARVVETKGPRSRSLAWCVPHIAALLVAAGAGLAAAFVAGAYQIPITGETLVPLVTASGFVAWFVFGLVGPARTLPAVLAASSAALLLLRAPAGPTPEITLTMAASALALGAALAARSARGR